MNKKNLKAQLRLWSGSRKRAACILAPKILAVSAQKS